MAIELHLSRNDNTPWGFRLTGGADCEIPLTVIKIYEESLAEDAGLQEGDIIEKINGHPLIGLAHMEAHDLIMTSGNEFLLAVRREPRHDAQDEEQHNAEIRGILRNGNADTNLMKSSTPKETKKHKPVGEITDDDIAVAISAEAEVLTEQNVMGVNFNKIDLSDSTVIEAIQQEAIENKIDLKNKKWSTFLQKPNQSKVVPKKKEKEGPKAPPYRVVIKKQPKRDPKREEPPLQAISETKEVNNTATNHENSEENEHNNQQEEPVIQDEISPEEMIEHLPEELQEDETDEIISEASTVSEEGEEEERVETVTESSQSLEEQLQQVQQQLQALALLPSSIQVSLDAVTQQLAKIVNKSHKPEEENIQEETVVSDNEATELQMTEAEFTTAEETLVAEETERGADAEKEFEEIIQEEEQRTEKSASPTPEENAATEEELERRRIEEEKTVQHERLEEFHQRRLEQRPTRPLAPLQRPIILPGGRKWSEAKDALPAVKKQEMSDEKICETLETFAEVITGKTKGINFLKYQPPPRNYNFLQNSEVFKLIHDAELATTGIAARPEKVITEEECYDNQGIRNIQHPSVGA